MLLDHSVLGDMVARENKTRTDIIKVPGKFANDKGLKSLIKRLLIPGNYLNREADSSGSWTLRCASTGKEFYINSAAAEELRSRSCLVRQDCGAWVLAAVSRRRVPQGRFGADGFRRQHQEIVQRGIRDPEGIVKTVEIDVAESPISRLRTRRDKSGRAMISGGQFAAGTRLHADFTRAHMQPRVTLNWDAPCCDGERRGPAGSDNMTDASIAARQRYYHALDAVGPELARILVEVCCRGNGIERAERALGLPRRSGKVVLDLALTSLARVYGLLPACGEALLHSFGEGASRIALDAANHRAEAVRALG